MSTIKYNRHEERVNLVQIFYQFFLYLSENKTVDATEILLSHYNVDDISKVPLYSKAIYSLALEHYEEIVNIISKNLHNWTFNRIDNVAKAILFVGVSDGEYAHLSPRNVIIDECVKIAKNYLKEDDYKFINAVLDKAIKK